MGQFSPSCACCASCISHATTFPSSADVTAFDDESGTWTHDAGSGEARTSDDYAQLIWPGITSWSDQFLIEADINDRTNGSKLRIIFGWVDTDNFWFAEFTFTDLATDTVAIIIGQRVAGSESTLVSDTGMPTGNTSRPRVCFYGGWLQAYCDQSDEVTAYVKIETTPDQGKFGIGTGDQPGVTARFDGFILGVNSGVVPNSTCQSCPNYCCDGYELPETLSVVISDFTSPYDVWNGTYEVRILEHDAQGAGVCEWWNPNFNYYPNSATHPLANPNLAKTGAFSHIRVTRNTAANTTEVQLRYTWADFTSVTFTGSGSTTGVFTDNPCYDDWGGEIDMLSFSGKAEVTGIF